MTSPVSFPIRKECPPGACTCRRDELLGDPHGDRRVLRLTREEEKRLIERIDRIASYAELRQVAERMHAQLGMVLHITPSPHGVRTVRGIGIQLADQPGLCRKIRQSVPAAIRRCIERHPEIAFAIMDAHDLLGAASHDAASEPGAKLD